MGGTKSSPVSLPIKIGIALTIILLAMIAYLASINRCVILESGALECRQNVHWFLDAPPNEIGDTIAGIFATLAFVWIVVTVFLQSAELTLQRKELALTRDELRLTREAQEKMVEAAQVQAAIFMDEKTSRDQGHAYSEISALADEIVRIAKLEVIQLATWRFENKTDASNTALKAYALLSSQGDYRAISDLASLSKELSNKLIVAREAVRINLSTGWKLSEVPNLSRPLADLRRMIEKISLLYDKISAADKVRVKSLGLDQLLETIEEIENHPNYWSLWVGDNKK